MKTYEDYQEEYEDEFYRKMSMMRELFSDLVFHHPNDASYILMSKDVWCSNRHVSRMANEVRKQFQEEKVQQ